ncbi:MAG: T9SS type A sorting domain-containing protein [Sporocytophaga sp.]|uniref:DUF7619 domain-containing protein n=1 Tax=Sporocytophaga sp. TaxID=2231183 RepID=UPI001B096938|nr:PQQ-binding-like beta-propeller repeat protein [Sporocytophaga sp.]MBO9701359.1 T9SS type A sorting domain-containing protein [Sporocytophaga sp.]
MKRVLLFLLIFIPFWVNGQGFIKYQQGMFPAIKVDQKGNFEGLSIYKTTGPDNFCKFDSLGNTLSSINFSNSLSSLYGSEIYPADSNKYLILGSENQIYKLIKTDTLGNILWNTSLPSIKSNPTIKEDIQKHIVIAYGRSGNSISILNPGGEILSSKSYSFSIAEVFSTSTGYLVVGSIDNYLIAAEIFENGDIVWIKKYEGSFYNFVQITKDGSFIAAFNNGDFIRYNNKGETLWTKKLSNAISVNSIADGHLIAAFSDGTIIRFDEQGNTLWSKKVFSKAKFHSISFSDNAIFAGYSADKIDCYITKIDFDANLLWNSLIKTSEIETITPLSDGGFIATCTTYAQKRYIGYTLFARGDKNGKIYPNYIKGKIINDISNNCLQDAGDAGISGIAIRIEPHNYFTFTNNIGEYTFPADTGVLYTISPMVEIHQTSECYPFRTISFNKKETDSLNNNFYIKRDLCPKLILNANISLNKARCFNGVSTIVCSNLGITKAENVEVSLEVPSAFVIKNASVPFSLSGNKYSFKAGNVDPNGELKISITDSISCNAQLGESAYIRSTVSTNTSCFKPRLVNDTVITKINIVGSFDPNDKQVFPTKINFDDYVNSKKELKYMIRFQNTGTWQANFIRVIDTLPSSLELSTIRNIKISHQYSMEVIKTNPTIIEWIFENINLPYQSQSEELSQGFISFTIDLKDELADKTIVSNGAAIYFDYNEPVITNRAITLISSEEVTETYKESITTGTQKVTSNHSIILFPNPITESSVIRISPALNSFKTAIYDSKGIKLLEKDGSGDEVSIQRNELRPGIYFFRIYTESQEIGTGSFLVK